MLTIVNARAVLPSLVLDDAVIVTDNGRILSVGRRGELSIPNDGEIYDACGNYVTPGFVDIHVHGGGDSFFYENPVRTAEHFLSHGETTVLATLYYDLGKEELIESVKKIKAAVESGLAPSIGGLYMEGPYMNPIYGASPEKNKWRGEIKPTDYRELVDEAGEFARVWAVAPEREGVDGFVKFVRSVNPDAVISVGHSEATPEEVFALKKYGMSLQTHSMNATGRPATLKGTRSCGPDEACMLDDDMYAEMISDSLAIHVHPNMQKLLMKVKTTDKTVLISDSFVSNEEPRPELRGIKDLSFDANGDLSGSKLTLDIAIKNVMKHTGCELYEAVKMATLSPARAVKLDGEIGSLKVGKKADIVVLNGELEVVGVMLDGKFVR